MEYLITPIPKPRMTRRDQWLDPPRPRVQKYRTFCDRCRLAKVFLPLTSSFVLFVLPMPESWSGKKKCQYEGKPHSQTPDLDNLLKALGDAVYSDDSSLWDIHIRKLWGYEGKIIIQKEKGDGV